MEQLKQLLTAAGIAYKENEPLAAHCTFKIGGAARLFVQPVDHAQLCRAGPVSQPRVLQCKTSKGRVVKPCLSLSKKLRFYAPRHWPCGASRGYFK